MADEITINVTPSEDWHLQGLRKLRKLVKSMTGDELRRYEAQYIDAEKVIEGFRDHFCGDCISYFEEPDINCADCLCGLDITDKACMRSYVYDRLKSIIIEADFTLRALLGSDWVDEYETFVRGLYV